MVLYFIQILLVLKLELIFDTYAIFEQVPRNLLWFRRVLVILEFVKLNFDKSLVLEDQEELEFEIWWGTRNLHCIYLTEVQSSKNEIMCTEIEKICDFSAIFQKSLILVVLEFVKLNFGKSLVLEDQEELEFCIWGGIRILHCIYLVEVQSSKNEIMRTEIRKIGFCENSKKASFSFHYIIFRTSYSCRRIQMQIPKTSPKMFLQLLLVFVNEQKNENHECKVHFQIWKFYFLLFLRD